jgi:hypothetical protein
LHLHGTKKEGLRDRDMKWPSLDWYDLSFGTCSPVEDLIDAAALGRLVPVGGEEVERLHRGAGTYDMLERER